MKLLDRLVFKDLLPMFALGVLLFSALWFAADPVQQAGRYLAQGVPLPIVMRLVTLTVPQILVLTFPMGMLLAVLLGFGRMSADSETVALFAGGIPFLRVAAPAAVLGLFASGAGYWINDRVAPDATRELIFLREKFVKDLPESSRPFDLPPVRTDGRLQMAVHIEKGFDFAAKSMRQVTITLYDARGEKPVQILHAARAHWNGGTSWKLIDVDSNSLGEGGFWNYVSAVESFPLAKTPEDVDFLRRPPETLNFSQLRQQIVRLKAGGNVADVRNAEVNLWSKISLPFAALVFAVIGAPLGLRPQRTSKYTGWILSVLIIFLYFVLYTALSTIARAGGLSPVLAAWLPNVVGVTVGASLIWRSFR